MFAALLAAHVLGDFVLQTRRDVAEKHRTAILLKHGLIHALLAYVLVGRPEVWPVPLAIFCAHSGIDFVKTRASSGSLPAFILDQAAHVAVVGAIAALYATTLDPPQPLWIDAFGSTYLTALILTAGFVAAVRMGAFFVDFAVVPFLEQIELENTPQQRVRGLRNGGRTIGQLERALIFVFVLINQFAAIGFLIAAKSIFRFGELRERSNRMEAEYIIIGTLISFLWAIVAGLITRAFLA